MARLTAGQWEQARAEYEVRGISLGEVARRFGITTGAVSQRAKKEGWIQGKTKGLVDKKVNAVKMLAEYGIETKELPYSFQHTIETVAKERLQADGVLAQVDVALGRKVLDMLEKVQSPEELELVARARKHLAPQAPKTETRVTVTQQQAQAIQPLSPAEALRELARQEDEGDETSGA